MTTTTLKNHRDVGLDIARGTALTGIVAAHTLSDSSMLLYVLGNGIAPLMFALLTGVTMARTGVPSMANALLTGTFLFALGVLLGYTETPVIPVLQTLGVIHVTTAVVARLGKVVAGVMGLAAIVTGPFIQAYLSDVSQGPFAPGFNGEWDGSLQSLLLNGTYPLVTWWGVPLIGFAIGSLNASPFKGVLALGIPVGLFSAWHLARGSNFRMFGDVSHPLGPVSDNIADAPWVHALPYGHTGSALAAVIAASISMGIIWTVNGVNTGLPGTYGANTLSGYCINVLLCISPEARGGVPEWLLQCGLIAGVVFLSTKYIGKGPVEYVRSLIVSAIIHRGPRQAPRTPLELPEEESSGKPA